MPAQPQGHDNRTFRLGDDLSVRLPSGPGYAEQVRKEEHILPWLAPQLPAAIPEPLALGAPTAEFPFAWSVGRWLRGSVLSAEPEVDQLTIADELGDFLAALRRVDPSDGPPPGPHSFFRGANIDHYADEARQALADGPREYRAARRIVDRAVRTVWAAPRVWVHGDVAVDNLLVERGHLAAVIDFGCSAVGDPACDLVIAFTYFDPPARQRFRERIALDDDTWWRGAAWAVWKAAITLRSDEATAGAITGSHRVMRVVSQEFG